MPILCNLKKSNPYIYHGIIFHFPFSAIVDDGEDKEYAHIKLSDLQRVETLGMGGFGRVELVRLVVQGFIVHVLCILYYSSLTASYLSVCLSVCLSICLASHIYTR